MLRARASQDGAVRSVLVPITSSEGEGTAGNALALSSRNEGPSTENQRFPYNRNMIPPVLYRKRIRLQTYRSEFSLHDLKF